MRPDLAVQSVPQNSVANDQNQYAQHSKSDSTFLSSQVAHYQLKQCCINFENVTNCKHKAFCKTEPTKGFKPSTS